MKIFLMFERAEYPELWCEDLQKIEGIGPKIEEALKAAGITSYAAIAKSTAEELQTILGMADGTFNTADASSWPEQAKMAKEGKWDELKEWQDKLQGGKEVE